MTVFPTQARTRVVNFYACPLNTSPTNCQTTGLMLHAEVAYDDLNLQGVDDCYPASPAPVTTSCGLGMSVDLWDVIGADT